MNVSLCCLATGKLVFLKNLFTHVFKLMLLFPVFFWYTPAAICKVKLYKSAIKASTKHHFVPHSTLHGGDMQRHAVFHLLLPRPVLHFFRLAELKLLSNNLPRNLCCEKKTICWNITRCLNIAQTKVGSLIVFCLWQLVYFSLRPWD